MKRSFVTPLVGRRLILSADQCESIGIPRNGILYAVLFPQPQTFVVSPLPPRSWCKATKVTIYSHHRPGSLAGITEAITDYGLNILHCRSQATSHHGEAHVTYVVEDTTGADMQPERMRSELEEKLRKQGLLSDSIIFNPPNQPVTDLRCVAFDRPKLLNAYGSLDLEHYAIFPLPVSNSRIDLTREVFDKMLDVCRNETPSFILISSHPEEIFFQFDPIPNARRFARIRLRLNVHAHKFDGYFSSSLNALVKDQLNLNLFEAGTHVTIKRNSQRPGGEALEEEEAEMSFLAETSGASHSNLKYAIDKALRRDISARAAKDNAHYEIPGEILVEPLEAAWPPVFLSTNLRAPSDYARNVCHLLVDLGLFPVNLDSVDGLGNLQSRARSILDAAPALIVLEAPSDGIDGGVAANSIAPSNWLIFEEAYLLGKDRPVYCLRHASIQRPDSSMAKQIRFTSSNFSRALDELRADLQAMLGSPAWRRALDECSQLTNPGELRRLALLSRFLTHPPASDGSSEP